MNSRDLLIFAAGLPGVATPFLPFATGMFVNGVTPHSLIMEFDGNESGGWFFLGLAIPMFLPIISTLWQARRLWPGDRPSSERRSVLYLAALALAFTIATCGLFSVASMLDGETDGLAPTAVLLSLIAGNAAVLVWNRRRRGPPDDATECFLLGCYLCHAIFLLIVFIPDLDIGGMLVAWTCVVYVATIIVRVSGRPTLAPE